MSSPKDRDGRGTPGGRPGPTLTGEGRAAHFDPADTTNLDVHAIADAEGDDVEVLRAVVAGLAQDQAAVDDVLEQLGADFFSEDKGWRRLFSRLLADPQGSPAFKRRALADYLEWLERTRGLQRGAGSTPQLGEGFAHLKRLQRGQPTTLRFDGLQRIECRLGQCVMWITPGSPPKLAITGQPSVALEVGRIQVGRGPGNDVRLGERWPNVSRRHLVIEVTRTRDIVITDFSSHGTFVTAAAI